MDWPLEEGQRLFDGQSWTVEHTTHNGRPYPITVAVIGKQYLDGRIQRRIAVDVPGDPITPAEARQVIEALTEAAALADTEMAPKKGSRRPTRVDRTAPESGTARSLIATLAEALRFPAGRPTPRYSDPSSLRMPAAARRIRAASFVNHRPSALPALMSSPARVLASVRRQPVRLQTADQDRGNPTY